MGLGPNGDGWVPGADSWVWCGDGQQPVEAPPWPPDSLPDPKSFVTLSLGDIGREIWEARQRGYQAGIRDAIKAIEDVDDKWSVTTQNADTRAFFQWCMREAREAVRDLGRDA